MKFFASWLLPVVFATASFAMDTGEEKGTKETPSLSFAAKAGNETPTDEGSFPLSQATPESPLLNLPPEIWGIIAFWADRDRANFAVSCKRVSKSSGAMYLKIKRDYWEQVDSLSRCQTIFDFTKDHFDFFRRIAKGFPLMFNQWAPDGLTALHQIS